MQRLSPIIFTLPAIAALAPPGFAQKEYPMTTGRGTIAVILKGFAYDGSVVRLQASLRNDTPFRFKSVTFELNGYDANGNNVGLCGSGVGQGCNFELFDSIDPGQTIAVSSPGDFAIMNNRKMTKVAFKIKEAPYFIKYDIQSDPVVNDKYSIVPSFGLKGIGLAFRNNSSDVIEVAWDQSVYIDEDGNSSRLIRGNVNLSEKDRSQPNTVIPPGAKLQETVFPVDRVQQEDGKWKQQPMLPDLAWIFDKEFLDELRAKTTWVHHVYFPGAMNLTGREVRLFLRLLVNEQKQNIVLTFKIADMIQ